MQWVPVTSLQLCQGGEQAGLYCSLHSLIQRWGLYRHCRDIILSSFLVIFNDGDNSHLSRVSLLKTEVNVMTLREKSMAPAQRSAGPGHARRGSGTRHHPGAEHSCWQIQPRAH